MEKLISNSIKKKSELILLVHVEPSFSIKSFEMFFSVLSSLSFSQITIIERPKIQRE